MTYARGTLVKKPFNPAAFPREKISNQMLPEFRDFLNGEFATLVRRGCLGPFEEVRIINDPVRPRSIMPLSVEPSKPRLIYDACLLNTRCWHVGFSLNSVGSAGVLGWEGSYQGQLDGTSGPHPDILHPGSWPLFEEVWSGVTTVWTVLPFGWNESQCVYQTVS